MWKGCPHLGQGLQKELLLKVAWVRRMESRGIQNYPKRFQSAEGCYSQKAVQLPHMRIKMANKQARLTLTLTLALTLTLTLTLALALAQTLTLTLALALALALTLSRAPS